MFVLCRNVRPMEIASPTVSDVEIAAVESVETPQDPDDVESGASTPGSPPALKRDPPDLSDRSMLEPDAGAKDGASPSDAEDTQGRPPEVVDPAQPAAAEQQRLGPEAPQPPQSVLDDQARGEDGPLLLRTLHGTHLRVGAGVIWLNNLGRCCCRHVPL